MFSGQTVHSILFQPYFCGQADFCQHYGDPSALRQAKSNIDIFFPAVAVLEWMEESMAVAEEAIPEFFRGAQAAYKRMKRN